MTDTVYSAAKQVLAHAIAVNGWDTDKLSADPVFCAGLLVGFMTMRDAPPAATADALMCTTCDRLIANMLRNAPTGDRRQ